MVTLSLVEPGRSSKQRCSVPDMSNSVLSTLSPKMRLSVMLMGSLSDFMSSDPVSPGMPMAPETTNSLFHSQICHIKRGDGRHIEEVAARYIKSVHQWLPILSPKFFHDRTSNFRQGSCCGLLSPATLHAADHATSTPSNSRQRCDLCSSKNALHTSAFIYSNFSSSHSSRSPHYSI